MNRRTSFLALLAVLALAGCRSAPATVAAATKPEDEYVTVTVTGSNIPKRIKKSDIAAGKLPKDVAAQLIDKDKFIDSLQPGRVVEKGN